VGAGGQFGADLAWHVRNVLIGTIRNGAQTVLEWNLASAPDYGLHTPGGCYDCLGALTIDASAIVRNLSYYVIAHLSRFVAPGSIRVSSTVIASLPSVAFITPDERAVLLVFNGTKDVLSLASNGTGKQRWLLSTEGRSARTFGNLVRGQWAFDVGDIAARQAQSLFVDRWPEVVRRVTLDAGSPSKTSSWRTAAPSAPIACWHSVRCYRSNHVR
jgi:hypothetical protein